MTSAETARPSGHLVYSHPVTDRHLAQCNVGRLVAPTDAPEVAEFMAALGPINALAEATPGFVWRLADEGGEGATGVDTGVDDERFIVNLSVWKDLASLQHFVTRSGHSAYLRRRREWFEKPGGPVSVCWWISVGHVPTVAEAMARIEQLREEGPSDEVFPFRAAG